MVEIIKTILMGIFGLLTVIIPLWYGIRRKGDKKKIKNRDTLKYHYIFEQIKTWREVKVRTLTCGAGHELRDKAMKTYAITLLETYRTGLIEIAEKVAPETGTSCIGIHLDLIAKFRENLDKTDLPQLFIERMDEATSSAMNSACTQIVRIQKNYEEFFEQVDLTFDQLIVMLGLIMDDLLFTVIRMNGELSTAFKEHKK